MKTYIKTIIMIILILLSINAKQIDEEEFIDYFKEIHQNIYNVFEYSDDNEIYNCLAYSFAEDELEEQFYEFLKTIKDFEENGYRNYIRSITYQDIRIEEINKKSIKIYLKWRVIGLVKHINHEHDRTAYYEAIYTLKNIEDEEDYRIVGTQIINSERIISEKRYYNK